MKYLRFGMVKALILVIAFSFGCQTTGPKPVTISEQNNVVILEERELTFIMRDGQKLRGLMKKPKSDGPFPTIILIHGSGGITNDHEKLIEYLAKNGFAGVIYARRGFPFGGGSPDVKTRYMNYISNEIPDLNSVLEQLRGLSFVRHESICIIGSSEGGLITYFASSQTKGLKAVIGLSGVYDYLDWYDWAVKEYPKYPMERLTIASRTIKKILGCTPEECRDRYIALSPIHQVENINCPIMIVHGEKDLWVPIRQAYRFAKVLKDAGKLYEIYIYPNEGHLLYFFSMPNLGTGPVSDWLRPQLWSSKNSEDVLSKVMVFLTRYLK